MYMTEAIGVHQLLNNKDVDPRFPVTIVIADEVHERTMYTQMIIGLTRLQMETTSSMVLILMLQTVDVAELKEAIPGACEIQIKQHEFAVVGKFVDAHCQIDMALHHNCGVPTSG